MACTLRNGFKTLSSSIVNQARLQPAISQSPLFNLFTTRSQGTASAQSADEHAQSFQQVSVGDLMKSKTSSTDGAWLFCSTDDMVYDAVKSMTTHNVGALLVMNKEREGEIAGIITERDYLRKIIVQGRSSKSTKVGDIMTEENKLITVSPETKVLKAMQLMTGRGMTVCIYRECYTREACHTLLALEPHPSHSCLRGPEDEGHAEHRRCGASSRAGAQGRGGPTQLVHPGIVLKKGGLSATWWAVSKRLRCRVRSDFKFCWSQSDDKCDFAELCPR
eukprot:TRINITY_DN250_c0_g1_i1.p1 TRINITY_DN250_c0_g1~~TRINITY_DN250_c0_g1_i1.p1  ORF type:complete len:277 (-),score=10.62 TRINITY_DN250_c0_g1_i1:639-1469(-)